MMGRVRQRRKAPAARQQESAARPQEGRVASLVNALLGDGPATVAVLSANGQSQLARQLQRRPGTRLVDASTALSPWDLHARLLEHGPPDLIVDADPKNGGRYRRIRAVAPLLRPGGSLVVRNLGAAPKPTSKGAPTKVRTKLELLAEHLSGPGEEPPVDVPADLAQSIRSVRFVGRHAVLTRTSAVFLAKLNERAANAVLAGGGSGRDRVVRLIPSERVQSRCRMRQNANARIRQQPEQYDAPELSLREYFDAVVAPGQVVATSHLLLPDTFRHVTWSKLRNRYLNEVAPRFATLPFEADRLPLLDGTFFHLDNELRGHFGHVMTEQVSRLWGWAEVKEADPRAKVLVGGREKPLQGWELTLLGAAGIPPEDIEVITEPVQVTRLLSCSPMFINPDYVHPAILETWRKVGDALAATAEDRRRPSRFFCTRHMPKRSCHNTSEVEDLFRRQGFEIVEPEKLSLPEQVALFRQAEVIAGFAGSGLFQLAFTPEPKQVITVRHDHYTAGNEYLMASVIGHELDQVISKADHPDFQSDFWFDHEREGRWLAEVFADLQ